MDSYKASKAWHFGHELAVDIHKLASRLPKDDGFNLGAKMRRYSRQAPKKIAESVERILNEEKVECYKLARASIEDLQEHLSLAS